MFRPTLQTKVEQRTDSQAPTIEEVKRRVPGCRAFSLPYSVSRFHARTHSSENAFAGRPMLTLNPWISASLCVSAS